MPDFGDEVAVSVEGEFKKTRDDIIKAGWSQLCRAVTGKIKTLVGKNVDLMASANGQGEAAQAVELDLKCAQTGASPQQAFDKLCEIAAQDAFPDIDPAAIQLINADNPATASAVVAFPKGSRGQVASLAQSYGNAMGLSPVEAPASAGLTQAHVMGFENVPAPMRPTLLADITQACADQGLDIGAVATSTRESGLLAGNVTIACGCAEEYSRAEAAIASIAPRWKAVSGGLSCAEGIIPADELPLSADELTEQASSLAAQLIDSGFPSPVVSLSRREGKNGLPDPDSFTLKATYDRKAGALAGLDDAKLDEAVGKWRVGEKAKIAKNGKPAPGTFAEKKMRALAGADIVTRDPAKMSPKGRNLVAENAERAAAAKTKALANMAKAAI